VVNSNLQILPNFRVYALAAPPKRLNNFEIKLYKLKKNLLITFLIFLLVIINLFNRIILPVKIQFASWFAECLNCCLATPNSQTSVLRRLFKILSNVFFRKEVLRTTLCLYILDVIKI
jgi:hypothetical protein